MQITKTENNGNVIFCLDGRLDTNTSPELQKALGAEFDKARSIELDFRRLSYVSSAGLRVLLIAQKASAAKGFDFFLSNVSPEIMEIFEITAFTELLKIV